jgi:hypothetical protein
MSRFLSSAMALTDLSLEIDTVFGSSSKTSFLACLQGMPCLHSLNLSIPKSQSSKPFCPLLQPPTPEDIVPLSHLTYFRYVGHPVFLSALLAGFSAPPLWDVDFSFPDLILSPIVHLSQFITEMEEYYHITHDTGSWNEASSYALWTRVSSGTSQGICLIASLFD